MTALRAASPDDGPAIAALHLRVALAAYAHIFPAEAPKPPLAALSAGWDHRLCDHAQRVVVAEEDDAIVGVVVAGPDVDQPAIGHLSRLYVEQARAGRGIGRRLHDAAVDHLGTAGYAGASLWVLEANDRVRAWYERLGWRATAHRKPVYEPGGVLDIRYIRTLP